MILAITGASGVGKTFAVNRISSLENVDLDVQCFHFDDVGMPNWDEVDSKKWQEETTINWINRLVQLSRKDNRHIIFEGSTEFKFYIQGFAKNNFHDYQLILFDCGKETMKSRLINRGQPELYTSDMINWLHYLRKEANSLGVEIIRTDQLAIEEITEILLNKLEI